MKLFDAHAHVVERLAGYGGRGELRAIGGGKARWANGDEIAMFPEELGDKTVTGESLKAFLDREGVEKAVLLQGGFYGFQNDYTLEVARKYPDTFIPACTVDPFCLEAAAILKRYLDAGVRVLKFEVSTGPGLMSYHQAFKLDGSRLYEFIQMAADCGCVLTLDLGSPGMASFQPEAVANIAKTHPSMKIVVCHLLAPTPKDGEALEQGLKTLKRENIWFDTSALPWNVYPEQYPYPTATQYLKTAREIVGAEKLIWGSDVPCPLTRDSYVHLYDYFQNSEVFTQAELEDIYYNNGMEVYGPCSLKASGSAGARPL